MDLRPLRHFLAVAEELHFGRAADRLGMTQPPLSQSIQSLEEDLGVRLFERTKRTVSLTPVGAEWLPHVRKVIEQASALPRIAARLQRGEIGAIRLAFVSIADYSILPRLLSRYQALHPEVDISLKEETSDLQTQSLLDGVIDAGLVIPPAHRDFPTALSYHPLVREPLVAALPEDWITSGRIPLKPGPLRFTSIRDEPLILFPRRSAPALHDIITAFYARHGTAPRLGQQAIQMQTILSLVSAGLGIALVPASLRHLGRTGVRYLPLADKPPTVETGLIWRTEASSPALRRFIEIAKKEALDKSQHATRHDDRRPRQPQRRGKGHRL